MRRWKIKPQLYYKCLKRSSLCPKLNNFWNHTGYSWQNKIAKKRRTRTINFFTGCLLSSFFFSLRFCPKLYEIPKIHKPNLPLRPIASSTRSPTSDLSIWLVLICEPLWSTRISYIKDSSNLVKKNLKEVEISSSSFISSFDIASMYTSIDVEAAKTLLEIKLLKDLDLISGETDLEVSVIMYWVRLCNKFS